MTSDVYLYSVVIMGFSYVVFMAIRSVTYQKKLLRYLLKNHTEEWKELTSVFGFGPGLANGSKGRKFLFSKEYFKDPEVLRLKVMARNAHISTISGMFTTFISIVVIIALS